MATYSGTSSIMVDIDLSTRPTERDPKSVPLMHASLTFVARSRDNKAVAVPRVQPVTPFEQEMWERGKRAQEERRLRRSQALSIAPPSSDELARVHALFQQLPQLTRRTQAGDRAFLQPDKYVFSHDTRITTTLVTMPQVRRGGRTTALRQADFTMLSYPRNDGAAQDRNIFHKVFGGFIMRQALETAWACGWRATRVPPQFLALDDIAFLAPVEVGTLLRFDAHMDFTPGPPSKTYSVGVTATMATPGKEGGGAGAGAGAGSEGKLTNTFHFTFHCDNPTSVPQVSGWGGGGGDNTLAGPNCGARCARATTVMCGYRYTVAVRPRGCVGTDALSPCAHDIHSGPHTAFPHPTAVIPAGVPAKLRGRNGVH